MRQVAHAFLSALPAKIFNVAIGLGGLAATLYPERVKEWATWLTTPEQIRIWGFAALAVFLFYWVLWWALKPKEQPVVTGDSFTQNHFGSGHNIRADTVNFERPPFKLTQDIMNQIAAACDVTKPVALNLVHDWDVSAPLEHFLRSKGFQISEVRRIGVFSTYPPHKKPIDLRMEDSGEQSITIDTS